MAIVITEDAMSSNISKRSARAVDGGWAVSWLPGRTLTHNQAITAMTIAEIVVTHAEYLEDNQSRWWLHIDNWAAELGVRGTYAVAEASLSC